MHIRCFIDPDLSDWLEGYIGFVCMIDCWIGHVKSIVDVLLQNYTISSVHMACTDQFARLLHGICQNSYKEIHNINIMVMFFKTFCLTHLCTCALYLCVTLGTLDCTNSSWLQDVSRIGLQEGLLSSKPVTFPESRVLALHVGCRKSG